MIALFSALSLSRSVVLRHQPALPILSRSNHLNGWQTIKTILMIRTSSVMGTQTSTPSLLLFRLASSNVNFSGLAGQINGIYVLTYSDTLACTNQSEFEHPTTSGCRFLAGNTIVECSFLASLVIDYYHPTPRVFCDQAGTGVAGGNRLHLSNLVPTGGSTGAIWYVQLNNKGDNGCTEIDGCPVANGVAAVSGSNPNGNQPICSPKT